MDVICIVVWFSIVTVFIVAVVTKISRARKMINPISSRLLPPVVSRSSVIGLLLAVRRKGLQAMIHDQYRKLGSVFTVNLFGFKVTWLIGPEVSSHFYQGMDSEISFSDMHEFVKPMVGKEVSFDIDSNTRNEQMRFQSDMLKSSKLRNHVGPMLQEVEDYFSKWGQEGIVDLKLEFLHLLMLISGRCLLGKEVRDNMFSEVMTLFHELLDNGVRLASVLFPYAPTPANRQRDRAHAKLKELFTEIVRSRRGSDQAEKDALQNLIDSKYRDGRPTSDEEVVGLIIAWIIAGQQTSAFTGTWTGAHLLNGSSFLEVCVEEQRQLVKKYGECIDFSALLEMDILHRCIKEALRMHPPIPVIFRKVCKTFTLKTKEGFEYEIPTGHTLVSPVLFNSKLPYIYKDPDVYDPDRFGPGREEDIIGGKYSYTPFSAGRHACLGEAYAYLQIKVIWCHLLRNFDLKLESPFPEINWSKMSMEPKGKVMVSYNRRRFLAS